MYDDINITVTNNSDKTISDVQIRATLYLQDKTPTKVDNPNVYTTPQDVAKYYNIATLFLLGDNASVEP